MRLNSIQSSLSLPQRNNYNLASALDTLRPKLENFGVGILEINRAITTISEFHALSDSQSKAENKKPYEEALEAIWRTELYKLFENVFNSLSASDQTKLLFAGLDENKTGITKKHRRPLRALYFAYTQKPITYISLQNKS